MDYTVLQYRYRGIHCISYNMEGIFQSAVSMCHNVTFNPYKFSTNSKDVQTTIFLNIILLSINEFDAPDYPVPDHQKVEANEKSQDTSNISHHWCKIIGLLLSQNFDRVGCEIWHKYCCAIMVKVRKFLRFPRLLQYSIFLILFYYHLHEV